MSRDVDATFSNTIAACHPGERPYFRSYLACCACTLAAWCGHADACVRLADGGAVCARTPFGAHGVLNALATLLFPLQLFLMRDYERQRKGEQASAQEPRPLSSTPPAGAPAADSSADIQQIL